MKRKIACKRLNRESTRGCSLLELYRARQHEVASPARAREERALKDRLHDGQRDRRVDEHPVLRVQVVHVHRGQRQELVAHNIAWDGGGANGEVEGWAEVGPGGV